MMIIISIYTNHNKFVEISGLNSSRNEKKDKIIHSKIEV